MAELSEAAKARIALKKEATATVELLIGVAGQYENRKEFLLACREVFLELAPLPKPTAKPPVPMSTVPMTDEEATKFARTKMPFGKDKGKAVKDVELSYLFWIDGENQFGRDLHRYLLSESVQREQVT